MLINCKSKVNNSEEKPHAERLPEDTEDTGEDEEHFAEKPNACGFLQQVLINV